VPERQDRNRRRRVAPEDERARTRGMIAVLGGLGAAVAFTVSALCASAASRSIGSAATLGGVMAFGLALVALPTILFANAGQLTRHAVVLLVISGLANVMGLGLEYAAFRRGKVGVVVPISSTEGAVAAVIAVVAGLPLATHTAFLLVMITIGVVLAAAHPDPGERAASGTSSALLAIAAAGVFGVGLYTTGRVGLEVSVLWVVVAARLFGTALILPIGAPKLAHAPSRVLVLIAVAGAAEVLGFVSYTLGARHGLAVAAVLSTQFAGLSSVGAYFIFHERLNRLQLAGLVVMVTGVTLLAAT
jgi:drug/metabolite transporter (DMT)-like permease